MGYVAKFSRREAGGYDASYGKGSRKITAVLEQRLGVWGVTEGYAAGEIQATKKLSTVKEEWGVRAEAAYGGDDGGVDPPAPPARTGPPSLRKGPPSLRTPAAVKPPVGPPSLRKGRQPGEQAAGAGDDTFGEGFSDHFVMPTMAAEDATRCPHCEQPFQGWTRESAPHLAFDRYIPPCRCSFPNGEDYTPDPFDPRMYKRSESGQYDTLTPLGSLDMIHAWMLRNREYVTTDGKLDEPWASVQRSLWNTTGYREYRPARWGIEEQTDGRSQSAGPDDDDAGAEGEGSSDQGG